MSASSAMEGCNMSLADFLFNQNALTQLDKVHFGVFVRGSNLLPKAIKTVIYTYIHTHMPS